MGHNELVEAVLEAQYLRAIAGLLAETYGQYEFKLYKPSAQDEAYLGFDQAWVPLPQTPAKELYADIRASLAGGPGPPRWYLAFFLQFKAVEIMVRRSRAMPEDFEPPYCRVQIALRPHPRTRESQHEVLRKLSTLPLSEVYYACPMMFSRDDVYRDVNVSSLRLVDVRSAPAGYLANQSHYIAFRNANDPSPQWCSEPTPALGVSGVEWIKQLHLGPESRNWLAASLEKLSASRGDFVLDERGELVGLSHRRSRRLSGGSATGMSPTGLPLSLVIVSVSPRGG